MMERRNKLSPEAKVMAPLAKAKFSPAEFQR